VKTFTLKLEPLDDVAIQEPVEQFASSLPSRAVP
jgi:hypothetical protein